LVAASLLVVAAAGCRTYPPLEPVRLAALETDLGQLLLVGFEGTEAEGNQAVERLLCETRVGGVVLFARNITGDEQAGRLTPALDSPRRSPPGSSARATTSRSPSWRRAGSAACSRAPGSTGTWRPSWTSDTTRRTR